MRLVSAAVSYLRPCLLERMWFSNVVFPAPKKPVTTVTGRLFRFSALNTVRFSKDRNRFTWFAAAPSFSLLLVPVVVEAMPFWFFLCQV